ncbi:diguanylate cyclase domain-containing protein [Arenimonas alkanexedens]
MIPNQRLMAVIATQAEIARLGLDLAGVMHLVVERILPLVDADGAVIELVEGEDMVYRAAAGSVARNLGMRVPRVGSLAGLCVQRGELLHCEDSETDPRVDREGCRRVGLRAMMVLPLIHDKSVVGVLKATSKQAGKFTGEDAAVLGLVGDAIAAAMFHATRHAANDLFYLATHDTLTDLPNRALFADRLNSAVSGAHRKGVSVGALMVDLDDFKPINDEFGHACGDAVLAQVANRLKACARASDTVARIGGDEFALVLSPLSTDEDLHSAIDRLHASLAPNYSYRELTFTLKASIGGALALAEAGSAEELLALADQRMYAAKRAQKTPES